VTITKLVERRVEKVWGRQELPDYFGAHQPGKQPVGEIWFELPDGSDTDLLVKFLFTAERLSIQVHPDDEAARAAGHSRGKDEAWVIVAADPEAKIGLGLRRKVSKSLLMRAAMDGSIEHLLDWRSAAPGEVIYSPAGTVHALGSGLTLIEIQQNVDLTYRLYDYGRPRELHLDEAVKAANPAPYRAPMHPYVTSQGREILAHGAFILERWSGPIRATLGASSACPLWLVPLRGRSDAGGASLELSQVWHVDTDVALEVPDGSELLVAYVGHEVRHFV
jgi:mannose-6-phosphate isomerase